MASRKCANHASPCANTKHQSCAHMLCKLCCVQAMCTWVLCKLCVGVHISCVHMRACMQTSYVARLCKQISSPHLPDAPIFFWVSRQAAPALSHGPRQGMLQAEQGRGWAPPRARRRLARQWWGPTLRKSTVAVAWTETVAWWLAMPWEELGTTWRAVGTLSVLGTERKLGENFQFPPCDRLQFFSPKWKFFSFLGEKIMDEKFSEKILV